MSYEQPGSLLLGSDAQLALLDVDEAGLPARAYELGEQAGRFTGDRIFSTNPRLYRAIAALVARSIPYREISEICSVSVNTVCAVCQREGVPIETIRERIARLGMDVTMLTLEAIRDLMADPDYRRSMSVKDLAIVMGISFTNAQLAGGGATARMDTVEKGAKPSHDDYERLIRNVTGTGFPGDNPPQKQLDGARGDLVIDVPAAAPGAPIAAAVEPSKGAST